MKLVRIFLLSSMLFGIVKFPVVNAQVLVSDSLALVALYNATNGPGWTNRTNWINPNRLVSTWYGITVTGNRVTQINMNPTNPAFTGNNLVGTIPPEIGNLTALTSLDLAYNKISGSIPGQLGSLTNLVFLNLSNMQLTGSIPTSMGNLSNLIVLLLNNNQLTGTVPTQLGNLSKVTQINLTFNRLSGSIPTQVGNLSNLTQLLLDNNQLSGTIPTQLGMLSKLLVLSLSENQLTGTIPVTLGNITSLTELNLTLNQLSGTLPVQLGNLTNLQFLRLNRNTFTGTVPTEFGNLKKLQELLLGNNQLSGVVPAELITITTLGNFQIQNNSIVDLPAFSPITLRTLNVSNNNLTFEDLEPNIGVNSFTYIPQKIIPGGETRNLFTGEPFSKSFQVGGSANQYQWRQNGTIRVGATAATITIPSVNFPDQGSYVLFITSPLVPGLTLQTQPTVLTVTGIPVLNTKTNGVSQPDGSTVLFDLTEIGGERLREFEISNTGTAPLIISNIDVTGDFNLTSSPPTQLTENTSTTFTIRFSPTALGSRTGTMKIFSNSNVPVYTLNLQGVGDAELEIFNVVSTNLNGKHDFLNIRNIWLYPKNKLQIFDRWGNQVYEQVGYDNSTYRFTGISDSGKELPEGTYYYVLNKDETSQALTGFLLLRRN